MATFLHKKLDALIEWIWLLIILLIPVYFNPWFYNAYYFAKATALVFLVSFLLGLAVAQWFLSPARVKLSDLPAIARKSPLQVAALGVGLMWVTSTVLSVMPGKSLWGNLDTSSGLLPNLAWILFFMLLAQKVRNRSQIFRAIYTLLISSGVVVILGIPQLISYSSAGQHFLTLRVYSTDGNPLSLSGFLAMVMPLTLALMILNWYGWGSQPRSRCKFIWLSVLFGMQLCCLALAQYSISLLLFVIGIFIFFILIGIFLRIRATLALSVLSILMLAVIVFVLVGQVLIKEDITAPPGEQRIATPADEKMVLGTLPGRMQLWQCAAKVMMDTPEIPFNKDDLQVFRRLIGYGPETLMAVSQLTFPDALKSSYTMSSVWIDQPENHYLYLAVTLGVLGLLSFLALLAMFTILGFKLLSRGKDREVIILAAAFAASIAQYCAYIFFNPSRINPELAFWTVLALTAALTVIDSTGDSGRYTGTVIADEIPGNTIKFSRPRILLSVLTVILFLGVGSGLTVPLVLGNMKVQEGFKLWDTNQDLALASFTDATLTGPDQASYHDILAHFAYTMAREPDNNNEMKRALMSLVKLAGNEAIRIEPQMAIWRYRLADRQMYKIIGSNADEKATISYLYEEANQLFPGNAVILDRWALALIVIGDYEGARQKLVESEIHDPAWAQTSYLKGLLKIHEGDIDNAGGLFVSPVEGSLDNAGHFMNFCGQLADYGEIGLVKDALRTYVKSRNDDWTGFMLLGVVDIYDNSYAEAVPQLHRASQLVTGKQAAMLASVIDALLNRNADYSEELREMVRVLMEKAGGVR